MKINVPLIAAKFLTFVLCFYYLLNFKLKFVLPSTKQESFLGKVGLLNYAAITNLSSN